MATRARARARRRPTDDGEAALAGRREDPRLPAGLLDDDEHHNRRRAHHEHRQHDDTLDDEPDRVTRFPLPHPHDFHHLPHDRVPDCLLFFYFLVILMLDHLLLAAAPPPALPLIAWAAPDLSAGRGRGVHREAVDPPSSKAQAWSEIWARGGAAAR
jgi:hypothetical protein